EGFVALPNSDRAELAGAEVVGVVPADEQISVTLVLRRRAELAPQPGRLTPDELAERYGAHPDDIQAVRDALPGLEISDVHAGSRRVTATGGASVMTELFGTELNLVRSPDPAGTGTIEHRARSGSLHIPAALEGKVQAVLG